MWSWEVPPIEIHCTVEVAISSPYYRIRKETCNFLSKHSFVNVRTVSFCMV